MPVSFDQPSYSVNESDGSIEITLVLSRPMGCNCYTRVMVTTEDISAKST